MIKLSIIVPVYNVATYLRKCIDSLLAQDIDNYEIVLVNDGSTDNSGAICDEYAAPSFAHSLTRSVVIKVIHQPNGGLSAARNTGIAAAKGKYLMFVDSDDYLEPNVLGPLISQMERDNLDVLRFKLQYVDADSRPYNPYKSNPYAGNDYSESVTDGVSFLNARMNTQCYACQFILHRDLITNIQSPITNHQSEKDSCLFTEGIYFEDTDWTPRMLVQAQRVASADRIVYNYLLTRPGSITNAINRTKQQKVLDDKMRLIGEMQRQSAALHAEGKDNVWFGRMIAATVISVIGILSVDFYAERSAYLRQLHELHILPLRATSLKARLINLSPCLAVHLLHLKNTKS